MRREGYELQVSRPEVITARSTASATSRSSGACATCPTSTSAPSPRRSPPARAAVTDLRPGDPGRTIVTFEAPARGLIGFRSLLLTATRGTALLHQHHAGWTPWAGELPHRQGGAMIADRTGATTGYALDNLQPRGEFFVGPGDMVYEGMVVGENAAPDDMVVNVVREKQKTNIRTHSHDEGIKLAPPVDAHAGDGHRVHRRRRAGRGHARGHPHPQAPAGRSRPPAVQPQVARLACVDAPWRCTHARQRPGMVRRGRGWRRGRPGRACQAPG